jgi:hypothetical protein
MKKKSVQTILVLVLLFVTLCVFSGCFSGDTALVTIHIEGRNTAAAEHIVKPKSLIDRFLMLFSSPAYAWSYTPDSLTITVTGSGMEPIEYTPENFSDESAEFTFEIPAGPQRLFTIITANGDSGINWGAQATVTLTAGQETYLIFKMIPITQIFAGSEGTYNFITIDTVDASNASEYRIYRSTSANGPYSLTGIEPVDTGYPSSTYYDSSYPPGTYYYRVSIYGSNGEGIMSEISDPVEFYNID